MATETSACADTPRAEFAGVLREIGAVVQGEHPIMNGEAQRIPTVNDKKGEFTIAKDSWGPPDKTRKTRRHAELTLRI